MQAGVSFAGTATSGWSGDVSFCSVVLRTLVFLVAELRDHAKHFIAGDVTSMMLQLVLIDCDRQFTSGFGEFLVRTSKLTSFRKPSISASLSSLDKRVRCSVRGRFRWGAHGERLGGS